MRGAPPPYLANFDSASAMLRALSRFLNGKDFPALGQSRLLEPLTQMVNWLPSTARKKIFALGGSFEAVAPEKMPQVSAEAVAHWMVNQYPRRQYPAMMIGSSNGALIHLCAALQIPWLPQTYLIPVRQSTDPDDPKQALKLGRKAGQALLEANPELQLHHMHDPSQDRLMVQYITYFRVKRRCLGPSYERFLKDHLAPGGTLFVVDCQRTWPTTQVGERYVFQHGAVGGVSEEEYLQGGPRVNHFLERMGSSVRHWEPPTPDGESPEAEWGFEPLLGEDIKAFAKRQGYHVKRIVFSQPEQVSPLVADLYQWWYGQRGILSNRLLVESFILMEPWWTLRLGAVPFWMVFNMEPSAQRLENYLNSRAPYDNIHMMLFAHGVESIGLPPIERWQALLKQARGVNGFIGVDTKSYPSDFSTFARYHKDLHKIHGRHPLPSPLSLNQLYEFLAQADNRYAVHWRS
ncbi:hypothetical protein [Nitrosococcus oceani]|uniref:hypothetical protein n=1 Tax=Nitrosococcus oceani TaxID=1229 RepID=UPI0004E91A67|nr:hypothetical protein [Nitrosococcus oceani]KFI22532.1 hypothetical protein HW44_08825 [Nitrosococcus oceani]